MGLRVRKAKRELLGWPMCLAWPRVNLTALPTRATDWWRGWPPCVPMGAQSTWRLSHHSRLVASDLVRQSSPVGLLCVVRQGCPVGLVVGVGQQPPSQHPPPLRGQARGASEVLGNAWVLLLGSCRLASCTSAHELTHEEKALACANAPSHPQKALAPANNTPINLLHTDISALVHSQA